MNTDPRTVVAKFLARKEANTLSDIASKFDTVYKKAKWVSPEELAAMVYCLKHGGDPDDLKGPEAAIKLMEDPEASDAFDAKRLFDNSILTKIERSEIATRLTLETVKKYRQGITKFNPLQKARLGWVTTSMAALIRYYRALMKTQGCDQLSNRDEEAANQTYAITRVMAEEVGELPQFKTPEWTDQEPYKIPGYVEEVVKRFQASKQWQICINHMVDEVLENRPLTDYIGVPKVALKDAEVFIPAEVLAKTVKEYYAKREADADREFVSFLGKVSEWQSESRAAEGCILDLRNAAKYELFRDRDQMLASIKTEVPALLIHLAASGTIT